MQQSTGIPSAGSFSSIPSRILLFLLISIFIGATQRFVNLGQKHFWHDEAHTSFTAAGITRKDISLDAFYAQDWSPEDIIAEFQSTRPGRGPMDIIQGQAGEEALNPPLYFVLVYYWVQVAGQSPASVRTLSAVFSLLLLPAAYILTRELGWRASIALMVTALCAVSPFQIAFAQEARAYSLSMLIGVIASIALLWALHSNSSWYWLLYTVSMIAGLYANVLTGFLLLSHAIYVLLVYGYASGFLYRKLSIQVRRFVLAGAVASLLYLPWVLQILGANSTASWVFERRPTLFALLRSWALSFSSPLSDLSALPAGVELIVVVLVLLVVLYSAIYMLRNAERSASLFVASIIAVNASVLMLADLIFGGVSSMQARYFSMPLFFIIFPVAYLLTSKLDSTGSRRSRLWTLATVGVVSIAVFSSILFVQFPVVRGKGDDRAYLDIIRILNEQDSPTLLVDQLGDSSTFGNILGMSHQLDPDVRFRFVPDAENLALTDFEDLFWLHHTDGNPDNEMPGVLMGTEFKVTELVPQYLWHLEPKE